MLPQGGRVVDDLIQGQQAEVDGHDLHDGAHAAEGGTDAGTEEGVLGQRRVAHPLGTELLEQAVADLEGAAVAAHVLPHQEHARIRPHRLAHRGTDRVAVAHRGHGVSV
jgi:hypothetical protein